MDCSQIAEEEEEEEEVWQGGSQVKAQWEEDEKLARNLKQTRMEGRFIKTEAMQLATEWVVQEHGCRKRKKENSKERRKVKGWSTEEKNLSVECIEEMIGWRSISQKEVDQRWNKLAER